MNQTHIQLPIGSREMNAHDYVSSIETAIQTTPGIDAEMKDAIKGMSNGLRATSDILCQYVNSRLADVIRNIPIIAFP